MGKIVYIFSCCTHYNSIDMQIRWALIREIQEYVTEAEITNKQKTEYPENEGEEPTRTQNLARHYKQQHNYLYHNEQICKWHKTVEAGEKKQQQQLKYGKSCLRRNISEQSDLSWMPPWILWIGLAGELEWPGLDFNYLRQKNKIDLTKISMDYWKKTLADLIRSSLYYYFKCNKLVALCSVVTFSQRYITEFKSKAIPCTQEAIEKHDSQLHFD